MFCKSGESFVSQRENGMAYFRGCRCSLVRSTVYRIRRDSRGSRRDGKSSLLLVSAASFVNAWVVLLVSISLSPSPVVPASRLTDGGSSQDAFLPHQKMAQNRWVLLRWLRDAFTYIKIPKQMNVKCLETATSKRSKENEWSVGVWIVRFLTSLAK